MAEIDRLDIVIATSVKDAKAQITQLQSELKAMKKTMATLTNTNPFKTTGKSASSASNSVRQQSRQMVKEYKKAATMMTTIRDQMAKSTFNIPDTAMGAQQALEKYQKMYQTAREKVMAAQAHDERNGKVYRNNVEGMYRALAGIQAARKVLNEKTAKRDAYDQLLEEERAAREAAKSVEQLADAYDDVAKSSAKSSVNAKYVNTSIIDQVRNDRQNGRLWTKAAPYLKDSNFGQEEVKSSFDKIREAVSSASANVKAKVGEMRVAVAQSFENMKAKADSFKISLKEKAVASGILSYTQEYVNLRKEIEKTSKAHDELKAKMSRYTATGGSENSQTYKQYQYDFNETGKQLDMLRNRRDSMRNDGSAYQINTKNAEANLKSLYNSFKKLEGVADKTGRAIGRFIAKITGLSGAGKKANKAMNNVSEIAKRLSKELTRVGKMAKLMVTRMAIRAVLNNVGEGFQSLAIHSAKFNESMSDLVNSSKTLGYSVSAMVSPLINALAPALKTIIELITRAVNALNQLFSALAGFGTWNRAKKFTDSWADSIKGTTGAAKELKKTVLGFDELNQLQDNKSSGGGGGGIEDMFEDVDVAPWAKDLAKKIKDIAKTLFDPIKKAWEKVGDFVKKSWKYAMDEVLALAKSVGKDFLEVWQQANTQKIFENILETIGWIGVAVGNLARQFRIAWEANETGKKILEAIRDIILIITEHIKSMAKATAEWAGKLNFEPLLTSVQRWLESLKPVFDNILGVIEDFYNEVVLKFTQWVIESGLPKLIDVFREFNEKVDWEGLREKLRKLWEHLEPFMETVGEGLVIFIGRVTQKLADFVNSEKFENFLDHLEKWMDSVTPEDVADAVGKLVGALIALKAAGIAITGISGAATVINSIVSACQAGAAVAAGLSSFALSMFMVAGAAAEFVNQSEPIKDISMDMVGVFSGSEKIKQKMQDLKKEYDGFTGTVELLANVVKASWYAITGQWDKYDELSRKTKTLKDEQGNAIKTVDTWGNTVIDFTPKIEDMSKTTEGATKNVDDYVGAVDKASSVLPSMGDNAYKAASAEDSLNQAMADYKKKLEAAEGSQSAFKSTMDVVRETQGKSKQMTDDAKKSFELFKDETGKVTIALQDSKPAYEQAGDAAKDATDKTADYVAKQGDVIKVIPEVTGEMETIKTTMDDVSTSVVASAEEVSGAFTKDKWTFSGVAEGLKSTFEKAKDSIKGVWNSIAENLNGEHEVGESKIKIKLPKFAAGGFPEDGLFMANHSEMVGKFSNGRTAVANNAQIVDGIQAGVYNAVTSALANTNSGSSYISNEIIVDGETIARSITKAQEKMNRRYSPQTV